MLGMVQRLLTANADARAERIKDEAEDVFRTAGPIGTGHSLERKRAGGQDQVESPVRDLSRNRVLGRRVVFRIEPLDRDGFAIFETGFREALKDAVYAFIQHRLRCVLENRDARDDLAAIAPAVPIGQQQNSGAKRYKKDAERKTFGDEDHNTPDGVISNGMRREGG